MYGSKINGIEVRLFIYPWAWYWERVDLVNLGEFGIKVVLQFIWAKENKDLDLRGWDTLIKARCINYDKCIVKAWVTTLTTAAGALTLSLWSIKHRVNGKIISKRAARKNKTHILEHKVLVAEWRRWARAECAECNKNNKENTNIFLLLPYNARGTTKTKR